MILSPTTMSKSLSQIPQSNTLVKYLVKYLNFWLLSIMINEAFISFMFLDSHSIKKFFKNPLTFITCYYDLPIFSILIICKK